mgnify:CR=1 FL=1
MIRLIHSCVIQCQSQTFFFKFTVAEFIDEKYRTVLDRLKKICIVGAKLFETRSSHTVRKCLVFKARTFNFSIFKRCFLNLVPFGELLPRQSQGIQNNT